MKVHSLLVYPDGLGYAARGYSRYFEATTQFRTAFPAVVAWARRLDVQSPMLYVYCQGGVHSRPDLGVLHPISVCGLPGLLRKKALRTPYVGSVRDFRPASYLYR